MKSSSEARVWATFFSAFGVLKSSSSVSTWELSSSISTRALLSSLSDTSVNFPSFLRIGFGVLKAYGDLSTGWPPESSSRYVSINYLQRFPGNTIKWSPVRHKCFEVESQVFCFFDWGWSSSVISVSVASSSSTFGVFKLRFLAFAFVAAAFAKRNEESWLYYIEEIF